LCYSIFIRVGRYIVLRWTIYFMRVFLLHRQHTPKSDRVFFTTGDEPVILYKRMGFDEFSKY
jgi:hypothetical protein